MVRFKKNVNEKDWNNFYPNHEHLRSIGSPEDEEEREP